MGTTTANAVVTQLPYGLLRNINFSLQPVEVFIKNSSGVTRSWPIKRWHLASAAGIPFYVNETLCFVFRAGNGALQSAKVCDLWTVNPSTGNETFGTSIAFNGPMQRAAYVNVTAINSSTGAQTTVVNYDVAPSVSVGGY